MDKLNTEQLEVAIQERDRPLIVDFFATWCGPCVLLAKELEQVRWPRLLASPRLYKFSCTLCSLQALTVLPWLHDPS